MQKPIVQAVVLIAAGIVLALVSNALASRDRKLVLPGYYPSAMQVPVHESAPAAVVVPKPALPATTTTNGGQAPSPVPTEPPVPTAAPVRTQTPARTGEAPFLHKPTPATAEKFAPHPDKPYVEVDYDGAAALQSQGALVLDARRPSVYEQGHIAGARPFSVWESDIDDKVNKLYEERSDPREQLKPILVYCSGGDCEDSHMLAQKLWGLQFNNVYVYRDGFPDWQKRGGPIHTGTTP